MVLKIFIKSVADKSCGVVIDSALILLAKGLYCVNIQVSGEGTMLLASHWVVLFDAVVIPPGHDNGQLRFNEKEREKNPNAKLLSKRYGFQSW